jgi:hypothetical protein
VKPRQLYDLGYFAAWEGSAMADDVLTGVQTTVTWRPPWLADPMTDDVLAGIRVKASDNYCVTLSSSDMKSLLARLDAAEKVRDQLADLVLSVSDRLADASAVLGMLAERRDRRNAP